MAEPKLSSDVTISDKVELTEDDLYDQSRRAQRVLDYVLYGDAKNDDTSGVDVRAARSAPPVAARDSGREASRVLFVTRDEAALSANSAVQREYAELTGYFDEVHVFVLIPRKGEGKTVRVTDRMWVYPVRSGYWWTLPFAAKRHAAEALVFHGSVRPDVIVGTDPYEAGLAALLIGRACDRPVQIHVPEDFTDDAFRKRDPDNGWRRRIARYVLKRVTSVRAKTEAIKTMLQQRFKKIGDIEVLPRFYNFTGYRDAVPAFDVHDKFRDFVFVALTFGELTADSRIHDVFAALNRVLHNPRIGLVVVGDGPAEAIFKEKVKLLGIERNVVFLKTAEDPVSLVKTADLLIETGTSVESEEYVMRAAAAGLPMLAVETALRKDLFRDGHSAFLCPPGDVPCLSQKFTKFLNSPALRKQFSLEGAAVARDRLIEDPAAYYRAFGDSIEVVVSGAASEQAPQQS